MTVTAAPERTAHVPYVLEQDEDGVWCADAQIRPGVGAHGYGDTPEAARADLAEALLLVFEEDGVPDEITVAVPSAA